ncbi:substrate-binding periplasmic protein [Roseateles oligotrophus]|uniref:Transporter substrate-binding domain-containing protein n=1 Tax=Roseateles oligotrophus TaxID=1769250 RepID=A0ABT2YBC7_9BURK|nr:transporter substrate-binding domain-containing protein [Roseateles oligotrophus]MCV2366932.1 transporter substrate-binding domain-containing protein [Roseateles oligotrophus]
MSRGIWRLAFFILAWALLPGLCRAQALQFYTHSIGDQVQVRGEALQGKPHGGKRAFHVEVVRALMADLGYPDAITVVPFARGMKLVQEGSHRALFNVIRTPGRESSFKWVGPLLIDRDWFYESSQSANPLLGIEQARSLAVCVANGTGYEELLARQGFSRFERGVSYETCLRMLKAGRAALMASSEENFRGLLASAGLNAADFRRTPVEAGASPGYIAFSLDTPDAEVQRWSRALEKLRASPLWSQLYVAYHD